MIYYYYNYQPIIVGIIIYYDLKMGRTLLLCAKRTRLSICATVAILWNRRVQARAGREASYSAQETSVRQKPYGPTTGQCTRRSWRGLCWRTRSRASPSDLGTVTDGANKIEIQKKLARGGAKKRVRTLSRRGNREASSPGVLDTSHKRASSSLSTIAPVGRVRFECDGPVNRDRRDWITGIVTLFDPSQ